MKENQIMVTSLSNGTVVINIPYLRFSKTWNKCGQSLPIDRETLTEIYYDPAVENLFKLGYLTTNDKEFLKEVGLMTEEDQPLVVQTNDALFNRMIKLMPLVDFKNELEKLTSVQTQALAQYAIEHYTDLKMDREAILSKASGRNILKSIENLKADEKEG